MEARVPSKKFVRRKAALTVREKALLDVTRIVGNQQDMLQRWLRRRDTLRDRREPADIGYPTLIRH
jgi:hypothetical protein